MSESTAVAVLEQETPEEQMPEADPVVLEELLVEEVSIDGMCGVY